jgi:hypothetical protein
MSCRLRIKRPSPHTSSCESARGLQNSGKGYLNPSPPTRHDVLTPLLVQDNSEKELVDFDFAVVLDEA